MHAHARRLLLAVLTLAPVLLAFATQATAQPTITPESLSNRRLGYLNDASALGWNPALLGVQWRELDFLGAGSYGDDLSFAHTLYALFGKFGPVALGSTGPLGDSAGFTMPRQYHAGFGVPVLTEEVWAGANVRWLDGRGFGNSAEFSIAGLYRPRIDLLAGLTLGNLTANNGGGVWLDMQTAFAANDWITLFGTLHFDERDTLGGLSSVSPSIGASFGLGGNSLVFSGAYDFNRSLARFGLEAMLGNASFGSINGLDNGGNFAGGVALVRWSSTMDQSIGDFIPVISDDEDDLGWAPDRAYVPSGLEYTVPASNSDAQRNMDAVHMPCSEGAEARFDSPTGLSSIVAQAGPSYASLAHSLREISPKPAELFRSIRRRFYTPPVRNREIANGDSLAIISAQSHSISVQSVDAGAFPLVSVIMRVTDETGRTVAGLGRDDFSFRDTTTRIVTVRPTDSSFNVPVDIVVMMDCSGSMTNVIESVRQNVERFVDNLEARGIDYRIGGVLYGSAIYDTLHPTSNIRAYKEFLSKAAPIGGDEITTLSVKAATEMNFRPSAQRVFIMITDDWAVQNNSRLDEPQLTQMLWDTRARLYSIITPCKNNSAVTTRLTLGREFDIRAPFTSILNDIGSDLTTTYELVYESQVQKEVVVPKVTILRGRVRDESGAPVPISFALESANAGAMQITTNGTTAEYETEITEGLRYTARLGGTQHIPLVEEVDLSRASKGDTITHDFLLRIRPTTVSGRVVDEKGMPIDAEVRIEDATTLQRIDTIVATNGLYEVTLEEGRVYRLTPTAKNYIPFPEEVDARVPKGTGITRDLKVMSIDAAIESGAVFRLKNIFFDFDRNDLKEESSRELDRLVALLNEYPVIKVEIGAHTDAKGSDSYNAGLSSRRAESVRAYLVAQGIDPARLTSKGYGESVPVASNDTDEGRAMNRRVEFKLVR
jgi:outer membrane protein OmpA-like peptidoglycan-associated protein